MNKAEPTVFIVDDDEAVRDALSMLMDAANLQVKTFANAMDFLKEYRIGDAGCMVLDVRMPGMGGLELQESLHKRRISIPIIFLTGHADVPMAVRALKKGAFDFIEKPLDSQRLVLAVMNALRCDAEQRTQTANVDDQPDDLSTRLALLSEREREVLDLILKGKQTRMISEELCISVKTVEFHRAHIREKLQVSSLAELFKLFQ